MEEEYRRLMARILKAVPGLTIDELEALVNEKVKTHPYLNKVGAILLEAEELKVLESKEVPEDLMEELAYTMIGDLVPGLNSVNVRGVVYAVIGPKIAGEHRILRLKIGDKTGVAEVYAWNEKIDELTSLSVKIGDSIAVMNAYTKEKIETGTVEIHVGKNSTIKKLPTDPAQPDPHLFYRTLSQVIMEGEGVYDMRGYLISISEEKKVATRYGEASVIELTLSDGSILAKLNVWRDMIEQFRNLSPGVEVFITDVKFQDGRFSLTSRSSLAMVNKVDLDKVKEIMDEQSGKKILRIIDVKTQPSYSIIIATDGRKIIQLTYRGGLDLKPGEYIEVYGLTDEKKTLGRITLEKEMIKKIESPGVEIPIPNRITSLRKIIEEKPDVLEDVTIEGTLYTKTNIVKVETRYGAAEKILFWLKDEDTAIRGVAWRSKAQEIAQIPEGEKIRLKWITVKLNLFNEPEIHVESYSKIEKI